MALWPSRCATRASTIISTGVLRYLDCVRRIYAEGAHFLFLLEQELGEDVMYDFIKEYVSRYKFKNATTEDFVSTLYDVVGTDNTEVNKIVNVFLDVD